MPDFYILPSFLLVFFGCMLIGIQSAAIGTYTVLRKNSLASDAIAHSILPGICIAYLLTGEKTTFPLLIGAAICGFIAITCIDYITVNTRLQRDAATNIVLSVFFGCGLVLLSFIQQSQSGNQSGLDSFLIGKAASALPSDIILLANTCLITLLTLYIFKKELITLIFDYNFAKTSGLKTNFIQGVLSVLLILSIITGIQFVGIILMAAMIIIPISASRFWSNQIESLYKLSIAIAIVSCILGLTISSLFIQLPTGASIVFSLTILFGISSIIAPQKGIIAKLFKQHYHTRKTNEDNLLKLCYHSIELQIVESQGIPEKYELQPTFIQNTLSKQFSQTTIKRLISHGFLHHNPISHKYFICREGIARGMKITRLHRLWEAYLMYALSLDIDHVHDDAESIEHILTPELERELEKILSYPTVDPHGEVIPPTTML